MCDDRADMLVEVRTPSHTKFVQHQHPSIVQPRLPFLMVVKASISEFGSWPVITESVTNG